VQPKGLEKSPSEQFQVKIEEPTKEIPKKVLDKHSIPDSQKESQTVQPIRPDSRLRPESRNTATQQSRKPTPA
jgi:hypothetical protein